MSAPSDNSKVPLLIQQRNSKLEQVTLPNTTKNYLLGPKKRLPPVCLSESAKMLLEEPSLWVEVNGVKYVPSLLVKALFVRRDGEEIDVKRFSVFIADLKRTIAKKWGVAPKSVWNKQKNAFWDKKFVTTLFVHCTICLNSPQKNISKFAYKIREDFALSQMTDLFLLTTFQQAPD